MSRLHRALYWGPGLCSREGTAVVSRTPERIDADVRDVTDRTRTLLTQSGLGLGHVVGAWACATRPEWVEAIERSLRTSFTHPWLASTIVLVPRLPGRAGFQLRVVACDETDGASDPAARHAPAAPSSSGTYSLAAASSDATVAATGGTPPPFARQMREMFAELRDALGRRGCALADVVSARVYLADLSYMREMNELYREAFGGAVPVRTTLGISPSEDRGLVRMAVVAVNPGAQVTVERMPPAKSGVLVPGIRVGDDVWLSGIAGLDAGGIERQAQEVMDKYSATLRDLHLSFADIVDAEIALRNLDDQPAVERVVGRYLRGPGLTRAVFQAADILGAAGIEMTLLARAQPR